MGSFQPACGGLGNYVREAWGFILISKCMGILCSAVVDVIVVENENLRSLSVRGNKGSQKKGPTVISGRNVRNQHSR